MAECRLTLSANAGLALELGGLRLWCDALHEPGVAGFSGLRPEQIHQLWDSPAFRDPDIIFFTHCHPDHYARALAEEAHARFPRAELILPQAEFPGQTLLDRPETVLQRGGLELRFRRLPHEGAQYAAVPHYGCIAGDGRFRVLLTGDCALAAPELADFVESVAIDLAVLDFPWITLKRGRMFVERLIRPKAAAVCHLPFPWDDTFHYLDPALRAAALLSPTVPDVRLLTGFLQAEAFSYE